MIRDGKLKALGVPAAKPVAFLPDVPSLSQQGLSGFESVGWFGIVAPASTPPDIIKRLNAAFVKALYDPADRRRRHQKPVSHQGGGAEQPCVCFSSSGSGQVNVEFQVGG